MDGDGYFGFDLTATQKGEFSLINNGTDRVDVTVHKADGTIVWSARVNPKDKFVASTSNLELSAGRYYFIVVSDNGSSLNAICSARY